MKMVPVRFAMQDDADPEQVVAAIIKNVPVILGAHLLGTQWILAAGQGEEMYQAEYIAGELARVAEEERTS